MNQSGRGTSWIRGLARILMIGALIAVVAQAQVDPAAAAAWRIEFPDTGGNVGSENSVAVDASGNAHIAYYDTTNGDLKYVRWVPSTGFVRETVDAAGNVGGAPALALDASGTPHIVYRDVTTGQIKYAVRAAKGGGWQTSVLDHAGSWPGVRSLALGADGQAHFSYFANATKDLVYLRPDLSCVLCGVKQTVDAVGDVGQFSSIAIAADGTLHISYVLFSGDWNLPTVKYARKVPGAGWSTETVAGMGYQPALALDPAGNPHISYYDAYRNNLNYAKKASAGGAWIYATVDSPGDVGWNPSIAVHNDGHPQISYYDATNSALKHARLGPTGVWSVRTVDSPGAVGSKSSIALLADGRPVISYYDATNGNLNLARLISW